MAWLVTVLVGYGLGSVLVAPIVARRHGVDLWTTSDGNPGAWNALEQLGARRAWPAFVGDGLKALAAGAVGLALAGWWGAWAGVAAAMLGHALPLRHPRGGGGGGKAVMCFCGGAFVLAPLAAATCAAACLAVSAAYGFAAGARTAVFALPLVQVLVGDPILHVAGTGALMTLIGLLFLLRRDTSARATSAPGAAPTS